MIKDGPIKLYIFFLVMTRPIQPIHKLKLYEHSEKMTTFPNE